MVKIKYGYNIPNTIWILSNNINSIGNSIMEFFNVVIVNSENHCCQIGEINMEETYRKQLMNDINELSGLTTQVKDHVIPMKETQLEVASKLNEELIQLKSVVNVKSEALSKILHDMDGKTLNKFFKENTKLHGEI